MLTDMCGCRCGLLLTLLASLTSLSNATCNPTTSVPNTSVTVSTSVGSGTTCFFPFKSGPNTYTDCTQHCSGSVCRNWCATSCNFGTNSGLWRYCNYKLSDLTLTNCANLSSAAVSNEPSILFSGVGSGTKCVFPFLYNNQCHTDCIKTSVVAWCPTTTENRLIDYNFKYCAYTLAGIATPECAKLNQTAPAYITPQLTSYSYAYNQTNPYANCTFPFYYDGKCYDDCTTGAGLPWYLIWCIPDKYYEPNRRIRFCPHYRKYTSVKNLALRWGFYRIYLQTGCGTGGALCNSSVAPANASAPAGARGARRLGLTLPTSGASAQMWEALPQPNGFFIFRSVVPCYTPAMAWSTDLTDATYENITQEREFWIVTSVGGSGRSGLYTIQSAFNSTAGYYLGSATVGGYSVLTLQPGVSTTWLLEEISNLEKSTLSVCDELDINGGWCSWTNYTHVGDLAVRTRNCSCPAQAGNGTACVGNDTQREQIVNGTWCAWSSYEPISGGVYATRTRICNCSAPAFGGLACQGSGNDTGLIVQAGWCSWSDFNVTGTYGTRLRVCTCPEAAYGGATCPGTSNDTGLTVDVAWCMWSAYSVSSGYGTRLRNCACPSTPAYGGLAACNGSSNDTDVAVDAAWCAWSAYAVDGTENETRRRNCTCPSSAYGGSTNCPGVGVESRTIVNGSWCAWTSYSVSSGWGRRNRTCGCSAPTVLGTPCPGNDTEDLAQINGTWCAWSSLTPSYGEMLRTRRCNCSAPNTIGTDCPGNGTDTYPCNTTACATTTAASVDGVWCEWSDYTAGPFNSGYMVRTRSCSCPAASGTSGAACPGSGVNNVTCLLAACRIYMAMPRESGSTGSSITNLSTFNKLVGLIGAICAAAVAALAIGAALTMWKGKSKNAAAKAVPA